MEERKPDREVPADRSSLSAGNDELEEAASEGSESDAELSDNPESEDGASDGMTDPATTNEAGISEEELEELRKNEVAFSWHASEYVHHHKGMNWYLALGGGVLVLLMIAVLIKSWLSIGVFLAMTASVVVYAKKPPRTLLYELSHDGIVIDNKKFPFKEFRSFGVQPDVEWHYIDLEPTKRFSPRITLLFEDADYEDIVGHLELHLPQVDHDPDLIERFTRYVRF